jgi:hypothetical protein
MHFIHQNLAVLIIIAAGIVVLALAPFCHWQEKRQEATDKRYYERRWNQWHPRT